MLERLLALRLPGLQALAPAFGKQKPPGGGFFQS